MRNWIKEVLAALTIGSIFGLPLLASACAVPQFPSQPIAAYAKALSVTVRISNDDGAGHGTGVYVTPNLVLTAAHVVSSRMRVHGPDGTSQVGIAILVDKANDLAMVYVTKAYKHTIQVQCHRPPAGARVILVGHPQWMRAVVKRGWVASNKLQRYRGSRAYMAIDATVLPGDSGGPVIDRFGRLVGIISATVTTPLPGRGVLYQLSSITHVGLIVPAGAMCSFLERAGVR